MELSVAIAAATVALAFFTAVLAWATWSYKETTVRMLRQMQTQARPFLMVTAEVKHGVIPIVRLTNVGGSTAADITGELSMEEDGQCIWQYHLQLPRIGPGEAHVLHPWRDEEGSRTAAKLAESGRLYRTSFRYRDVQGESYELRQDVSWMYVAEHLYGARLAIPQEPHEAIVRELNEIREQMKREQSWRERTWRGQPQT